MIYGMLAAGERCNYFIRSGLYWCVVRLLTHSLTYGKAILSSFLRNTSDRNQL